MLHLALMVGLLLSGVVAREVVRGLVQRQYRVRSVFELRTPGTLGRRGVTIAASFAVTYLAVVALAFAYHHLYGVSGVMRYAVDDVLPDAAATGILQKNDRIDAVDGELLFVARGPTLVDRVQAKNGATVELAIVRDGTQRTVQVTPKQGKDKNGRPTWLLGIRPRVEQERSSEGALGKALVYPFLKAKLFADEILEWATGSDQVEVGGVYRITEEFRVATENVGLALRGAMHYAGYLFLVFAVLDLIRLFVLIRDKVRG